MLLALALRVPATRIYFNTSPEFWLTLQTHYELALAERESSSAITREVLPYEQTHGT
jgi:plasmid maintenance system antidote protein VapI